MFVTQIGSSFRNFASLDHSRSNYLQYDLQNRVNRDIIIRNQKIYDSER